MLSHIINQDFWKRFNLYNNLSLNNQVQYNKNFVSDHPTLIFCEGVFKSKLVKPVKLRVIQALFADEVVFVL